MSDRLNQESQAKAPTGREWTACQPCPAQAVQIKQRGAERIGQRQRGWLDRCRSCDVASNARREVQKSRRDPEPFPSHQQASGKQPTH